MKRLFLSVSLLLAAACTPAPSAPADKALQLTVYNASTGKWDPLALNVSGNNGKVLGVSGGTWALVTGGGGGSGDALTTDPLSQFAATSSAQLAGTMTDENGTGKIIFSQGSLAVAATKTLTVSNNLTLTGTDGSSLNIGAGGALSDYLTTAAAASTYQPTLTGGASSIASSNLTVSRALASDGSGKVAVSAVTATELGYLSGVTSAVQTQISAKVPNGLIYIVSDTGSVSAYSPASATDSARGTALRNAVTAATTSGNTVKVGPGTFALGGNRLALSDGVHLDMDAGTVITSTADLGTDGCIIYPGNNSRISGGTVQGVGVLGVGGHSGFQAPIGWTEDVGDSARTGVVIEGVTMIGDTDGFYIQHGTASTAILRDCVALTKWDAIVASGNGSTPVDGAHVVDVYNCRVVITGPSALLPGLARGIMSANQATINVYGGSVAATNGGADYTAALATVNGGTLHAYGTRCSVSSSNPKYDITNVSGTLTVAGVSGSSTNGLLLTNGTITYTGAENASNISAGTLAVTRGGTGQTTSQAALNALMAASGALSQGDIFYYNGTNVVRLAAGTNGYFLKTQGAGANPVWAVGGSGSVDTSDTYNWSGPHTWNNTATFNNSVTFNSSLSVATLNATSLSLNSTAITADGTELNYVDGVTSAIQTQLNTKISASSSDTFTNKGYDAAGTGNTLKLKGYIYLTHPHYVDGTGATLTTTATSVNYGHATFSNSADQAANYAEYQFQVPEDLDTSVSLRARLKFVLGNTDTAAHRFVLSSVSVADSAVPASATLANAVNVDVSGDASGASGDIETSAWTTLTSWNGALTAGQTWRIRLARDGDDATNDASTVDCTERGLVIEYGISQ